MTHPIRRLSLSKNSERRKNRLRMNTKRLLRRRSRLTRSLFKFIVSLLMKTRLHMMQLTWYLVSSTPMMTAFSISRRSKHILLRRVTKLQIKRKCNHFSIKLMSTKMATSTSRNSFNICRNFFKMLP